MGLAGLTGSYASSLFILTKPALLVTSLFAPTYLSRV